MLHIISGNTKIGNTANISLPPIEGCSKNSIHCKDHCYALKFYRIYPEVKNAWDNNLKELLKNRDNYFSNIRRYLLKKIPTYFRWHISGDIIDQDYFNQMNQIATDYYYTRFLVFTKQYELDYTKKVNNLSVILSICPGLDIPKTKLPLAFIDFENENRAFNFFSCPESCEGCRVCWNLTNKNVEFSTKRS